MPGRRRNFRWVWGLVFLLLIGGAIVMTVLTRNDIFGEKPSEATSGQNVTNKTQQGENKKDEKKDAPEETEMPKKEEIPQYDGEDPNIAESLSGVISYTRVNNGNLMIRVNIDQYLAGGECALSLTRNGTTIYNAVVGIESSVATSTCSGFNIPVAELGSGKLEIKIGLKADGKSGTIEGEANI